MRGQRPYRNTRSICWAVQSEVPKTAIRMPWDLSFLDESFTEGDADADIPLADENSEEMKWWVFYASFVHSV